MISLTLAVYLGIGTLAMLIPIAVQTKKYKISLWKSIPTAFFLTITGTIGTYLMFFIENHWIGGTSFYGAVFFVPVIFPLLAKLLHESRADLLDICAPAECIMLAIMKVQCTLSGCCGGREITIPGSLEIVRFPSQIAELINALILFAILFWISSKKKRRGSIYPIYMLLYGCTRFVLSIFRESWVTTEMFLPYGNIWSLLSISLSILWLIQIQRKSMSRGNLR